MLPRIAHGRIQAASQGPGVPREADACAATGPAAAGSGAAGIVDLPVSAMRFWVAWAGTKHACPWAGQLQADSCELGACMAAMCYYPVGLLLLRVVLLALLFFL